MPHRAQYAKEMATLERENRALYGEVDRMRSLAQEYGCPRWKIWNDGTADVSHMAQVEYRGPAIISDGSDFVQHQNSRPVKKDKKDA